LIPMVTSGRLKWRDHVVPGIDNCVEALNMLFAGKNNGKLMVQITDDARVEAMAAEVRASA